MRPLAELLHQDGWTVHGLLLPGFGPEIATLPQRHRDEWIAAVQDALGALRQAGHRPLLLVGYSMGAAEIAAAASTRGIRSRTGWRCWRPSGGKNAHGCG